MMTFLTLVPCPHMSRPSAYLALYMAPKNWISFQFMTTSGMKILKVFLKCQKITNSELHDKQNHSSGMTVK